jgi:prepilin-type N-terminal cleavage/methylation domain-containing protein
MRNTHKKQGFTLSELLVVLGIMGLIATFTIPKVLYSFEERQNIAKFKETIGIIEQIGAEAFMEGKYNQERWFYILPRLNYVKSCFNSGVTDGCNSALNGDGNVHRANERALVLANGVVIGGIIRGSVLHKNFNNPDFWFIDVNGTDGPNTFGIDVLYLHAPYFDVNGTTNPSCTGKRLVCPANGTAQSLYNKIFTE